MKIPRLAVSACVIQRPQKRILMIARENYPNKDVWTFPGGKLEMNETYLEATKREVQEETGFVISKVHEKHRPYITEYIEPSQGYHYVIQTELFEVVKEIPDKKIEKDIIHNWFATDSMDKDAKYIGDIQEGLLMNNFWGILEYFEKQKSD